MPHSPLPKGIRGRKILLLFETDAIRPDNWQMSFHQQFDAILTWRDDLVDNAKYFKMYFPESIPSDVETTARGPKDRFCALIAGNKMVSHPLELYSERRRAIEWFERTHPEQFDLFGFGWDQRQFY